MVDCTILNALAAHGCEQVVICPGNRDLPLMVGLWLINDLAVIATLDERSAAFRALGNLSRQRPTRGRGDHLWFGGCQLPTSTLRSPRHRRPLDSLSAQIAPRIYTTAAPRKPCPKLVFLLPSAPPPATSACLTPTRA